jgi:AcrR family transcriptional regulator
VAKRNQHEHESIEPALIGRVPADYITGELPPTAQRILAAAQRVLMRDGYEGLTLRRIAEEAGVHKSLVTYHLESKDTLMTMLVDSLWHDVDVELFRAVDSLPLLSDQRIGALVDAHRRLGQLGDQQRMYVDLFANLARSPGTRRRLGALNDAYRDLDRRCLGATGLEGAELDALASLVLAVGDGMGVDRLIRPGAVDDDAVYALFERMIVSLAGHAGAPGSAAPDQSEGRAAARAASESGAGPDRAGLVGADPLAGLAPVARALVLGARRVLRRRGLKALTLEAVGREADEPPSAVTYYFGDKRGLLTALVETRLFEQRKVAFRLFACPGSDDTHGAHALCSARALLGDMTSFRAFFELLPTMLRDPHLRELQAGHERWLTGVIAGGLARSDDPAVADRGADIALLSVAAADGLAMQVLADPSGFDPAASCTMLERLIRDHTPGA